MMSEYRIGSHRDPRHGSPEFEETAPHMIPAGDEAKAAVPLLMHPIRGFPGVAESVVGSVAEHDAAGGIFGERSVTAQQLVAVDPLVDPGNEELLGLAGGEQL